MQVPQQTTQNPMSREIVSFYGDQLTAVKDENGEIWTVINDILRNIGFDEQKVDNQRKSWKNDVVIQRWCKILPLPYQGVFKETNCINRRAIPIALAKISITPTMRRDHPEIVEKLIRYQEECADVLYRHFMSKNSPDAPITREELSLFLMQTAQLLNRHISWVEERDRKRDASINNMVDAIKMLAANRTESPAAQVNPLRQSMIERIKAAPADIAVDQYKWLQYIWANVRKVSERTGWTTTMVFRKVYAMMSSEGICTAEKYKAYRSKTGRSKINMCAEDADLRKSFHRELLKLIKMHFPEIYGGSAPDPESTRCLSRNMVAVPAEVKDLVTEYSNANHISYRSGQIAVYRELEKRLGVKLKTLTENYAKAKGYATCSNGYYISQSPETMDILRKIVKG